MKIIIAPSKTMKPKPNNWETSPLIFPQETKYLHHILEQYNDEELCQLMKISYKQATQVYQYYHQDYTPHCALSLYQGTVFKQLDLNHYDEHLSYLDEHVRIMSAYYGVLKYNTLITPYRLDMTMKLPLSLYEYWYTPIYQYFENEDVIISLASQEFTSMIHHPHLYFIDFIEIKNNQKKRNAMIIKKARGHMLNQIILKEINTLEDIKHLDVLGFHYDESESHDNIITFIKKDA